MQFTKKTTKKVVKGNPKAKKATKAVKGKKMMKKGKGGGTKGY